MESRILLHLSSPPINFLFYLPIHQSTPNSSPHSFNKTTQYKNEYYYSDINPVEFRSHSKTTSIQSHPSSHPPTHSPTQPASQTPSHPPTQPASQTPSHQASQPPIHQASHPATHPPSQPATHPPSQPLTNGGFIECDEVAVEGEEGHGGDEEHDGGEEEEDYMETAKIYLGAGNALWRRLHVSVVCWCCL